MGAFVLGDKKSFPTVSYLMAIEKYIITCYMFVFGALLECAVVHYIYFQDYRVTKVSAGGVFPPSRFGHEPIGNGVCFDALINKLVGLF